MGPSGSGKTTLLSALALRLDTFRMNIKGDLRMNGHVYTKHQLKCISGYVMQDDLVNPNLTVAETLSYTAGILFSTLFKKLDITLSAFAELRMARNLTKEERLKREVRVMKLMGIYHRKDVIVGDTRKKVCT
jgi:ABC-type Fe3+/spermidine/putrescine transport system ATPase subunit